MVRICGSTPSYEQWPRAACLCHWGGRLLCSAPLRCATAGKSSLHSFRRVELTSWLFLGPFGHLVYNFVVFGPLWRSSVQLRCFCSRPPTAICFVFAHLRRAAQADPLYMPPSHTPHPRAPAYLNRPPPVSTSSRRSMAAVAPG
jgi:hypothetical protein